MNEPIVTLDTFSLQMQELLKQKCIDRGVEFMPLRLSLLLHFMNNATVRLDSFALEMLELLNQQCTARDVKLADLRRVLVVKWAFNCQDPLTAQRRALLDTVHACQVRRDAAGYRQACLDYLKQIHGLEIGESVVLFKGRYTRTVRIEDFTINILMTDSLNLTTFHFWGRCTSHKTAYREFAVDMEGSIKKVELETLV